MRPFLFILVITAICLSCKKDSTQRGEMLEIYLLKSYQWIAGKCQVNGESSVLRDTAIVKNQDILQYSKASYQFELTESSLQRIKALHDGTPFAVTIDKIVIYYGILKPSYSSSTCLHSITMDYVVPGNKIMMNLGYVGTEGYIDDQRNNSKLVATLKYQGKLR